MMRTLGWIMAGVTAAVLLMVITNSKAHPDLMVLAWLIVVALDRALEAMLRKKS